MRRRTRGAFAPAVAPDLTTGCGAHSTGTPGCSVTEGSCTPRAARGGVWSSTTVVPKGVTLGGLPVAGFAWIVALQGGNTSALDNPETACVRAVRNAY